MASLNVIQEPGEVHLLLQYQRALSLWASHCADEAPFGMAGVYANSRLADIPEANCILGPLDGSQLGDVTKYFADARVSPQAWHLPGDSPAIAGMRDQALQLWRLDTLAAILPQTHPDLTIIPARASFGHVSEIACAISPNATPAQAAEAAMCHLDDSRVDAVLALHNGKAAAYAAVLSTGEVGFIMELFVRPDLRHQKYGLTMAGRAMDICARSLFRTVCCAIHHDNPAANAFATRLGFRPVEKLLHRVRH